MKKLILVVFFFHVGMSLYAQTKPYKNGTLNFGVFDKETSRTTARCSVTINGDNVTARVIQNLYENKYSINQIIYSGTIIKVGKFYYIIEDDSPPISSENFDRLTPRIDFERGYIIHY
jgi:hypothetical protein